MSGWLPIWFKTGEVPPPAPELELRDGDDVEDEGGDDVPVDVIVDDEEDDVDDEGHPLRGEVVEGQGRGADGVGLWDACCWGGCGCACCCNCCCCCCTSCCCWHANIRSCCGVGV